jgi:hypothetical protein
MVPDISKSIRWLFSSRGWANRWCRDRTRWHLWNSARFEGYRILREHPPHQRIVFLDPSTIHGPCSNSVNDRHQPAGPSESRSSCIFDLPLRSYVVDVSGATWSDFDFMHSCPVESSVLRSLYSSHACVRCGSMCFAVGKRFIRDLCNWCRGCDCPSYSGWYLHKHWVPSHRYAGYMACHSGFRCLVVLWLLLLGAISAAEGWREQGGHWIYLVIMQG